MDISAKNKLGKTKVEVTAVGFGCAPLAGLYREAKYDESLATLKYAYELGIRYFDTAPMYGLTKSEHVLGHGVRAELGNSHDVTISTKVGRLFNALRPGERDTAEKNEFDAGWVEPLPFKETFDYSYDAIMRSFEDSQQRLGMSYIAILYVHDIGRVTHGEKHDHYWGQLTKGGGFKALGELRKAGFIGAIGLGVNEWQAIDEAIDEFDIDCSMLAGRYTLLEQEPLDKLFPKCERHNVSIVSAAPFNSGILASTPAPGAEMKFNYQDAPPEIVARVTEMARICRELGVELPHAAVQFPLFHPVVVSCVAGVRSRDKLKQNADWINTPIPPEFWAGLKRSGVIREDAPTP